LKVQAFALRRGSWTRSCGATLWLLQWSPIPRGSVTRCGSTFCSRVDPWRSPRVCSTEKAASAASRAYLCKGRGI